MKNVEQLHRAAQTANDEYVAAYVVYSVARNTYDAATAVFEAASAHRDEANGAYYQAHKKAASATPTEPTPEVA